MRMAIVSNGPNAGSYSGSGIGYDVVACVNGAAAKWECDWWVFNDYQTWEKVTPLGVPRIFTKAAVLSNIADLAPHMLDRFPADRCRWQESVTVPRQPTGTARWNCYSGVAAMGLAISLAPTELDIYGVEMASDGGLTKSAHRTEQRWVVERRIVDWLCDVLRERNCRVRFVP